MQIEVTDVLRKIFRSALADWYVSAQRDLPWRKTDDPYRIWLSEVMLQQTRVDQATPYYRRFVERFPTVRDLADADLDDVLLSWEGLGYYSRARNLHRAARKVVDDFAGEIPSTFDDIRTLPGVGPYTAAAVLSIAFERPHAVLDGNVIRVLSRVFAVETDVRRAASKRMLQQAADALMDPASPGEFNQAMMELGARICTPRSPSCTKCPVSLACKAFGSGRPEAYPKSASRPSIPHHDVVVAIIYDDIGRVLIQRRPDEAMLGGLWEFPGGKRREGETLRQCCTRELREELGIDVDVETFFCELSHAYSHFRITLYAFRCSIARGRPRSVTGEPIEWIRPESLDAYPFPRASRRLIEEMARSRRVLRLFDA